MVNHHQIFQNFRCWKGEVQPGFSHDFLGVVTRISYFSLFGQEGYEEKRYVEASYPPFDNEYFEWVDLLEAVVGVRQCFTMIELGTGWGRWLCRAAAALRQYDKGLPYRLVGVEAEPTHYQWMREHLVDNVVDLEKCRLIEAAVGPKDGTVDFLVGDAQDWYGQRIAGRGDKRQKERVKSISLKSLLNGLGIVDLIDLDIQGEELAVLSAASREIDRRVKRIHTGTHSRKIEKGIVKLFKKLNWQNNHSFPCNEEVLTEYGKIYFEDGVQSWVNPKLVENGNSG